MANEYKLTAPNIDFLLDKFEDSSMRPSMPSIELRSVMDRLFDVLHDLAPSKERSEEKSIWIRIPRGTIENYASYDDMVKWGEVENREEYEIRWNQDYPETDYWYELVVREVFHKDGTPWFRGVWLGNKTIVNPWIDQKEPTAEEAEIEICTLIAIAAEKAMEKVKEGTYNDEVRAFLPGYFHDEMIKDTDEEDKSAGTDGSKIQNPGIRREYVFQRRMITRSANYNILCRWLTERFQVKNDQYAL